MIYNKINTYDYYRQRVYKLEDTDYDPSDRAAALQKSLEWDEKIPIGIIYQETGRPAYESQVDVLQSRTVEPTANGRPIYRGLRRHEDGASLAPASY